MIVYDQYDRELAGEKLMDLQSATLALRKEPGEAYSLLLDQYGRALRGQREDADPI